MLSHVDAARTHPKYERLMRRLSSFARVAVYDLSGTVRDLTVGSDIRLSDRGERQLKGVPASGACSR